jgi:hypothetical protein
MAFTAGEVIAAARAYHPAFDSVTHTDEVCFDWLNGFVRRERRRLMAVFPETLIEQAEPTPFPPIVFSEGVSIQNAEMVFSVQVLTANNGEVRGDPAALIPLEHLQDPGPWPAVAWVGGGLNRLYLKGGPGDWADYVGVLVNFIAYPTPLTSLSDDVQLPEQFIDSCAANLAVFMAVRSGAESIGGEQLAYLRGEASEARAAALLGLGAQRAGETFRIREMD